MSSPITINHVDTLNINLRDKHVVIGEAVKSAKRSKPCDVIGECIVIDDTDDDNSNIGSKIKRQRTTDDQSDVEGINHSTGSKAVSRN